MARCPAAKLVCEGTVIGAFDVPPFEVRTGELVALEFPERTRVDTSPVFDALSSPETEGPIRAAGKVFGLQFVFPHSALREFFRRERVIEWFRRETKATEAEALARLNRIGVRPDVALSTLAGNPRWLMSFEAALARGAEILVFRTAGLDPLGIRRALELVVEELEQIGAVHLCPPRGIDLPDVYYSARVAVTPRELQPATE